MDIQVKLAELTLEVKNTNNRMTDLIAQLAVNTHVLNEHHKRSITLEEMVKPLQEDYAWRRKLWTLVMGSSGLIAMISLVVAIISLLKH